MKNIFFFILIVFTSCQKISAQADKKNKRFYQSTLSVVKDLILKETENNQVFNPIVIGASAIGSPSQYLDYKNDWAVDFIKNYPSNELCTDFAGRPIMRKGSSGNASFRFRNVGDKLLEIYDTKSSCGCVKAIVSRTKIRPGEIGIVELIYDTKRVGKFNKTVTLETNTQNKSFRITLNGEVAEPSRECPICNNNTAFDQKPVSPVIETNFSEWFTTKLSALHNNSKEYFILSCRYRVVSGNKIELELKCQTSFKLDVTSKICSQTPDGGNSWVPIKVNNESITKVTISEKSNCQNGFWWWIRNVEITSTFID
jgi:Protein of unknown function (DUF1573)